MRERSDEWSIEEEKLTSIIDCGLLGYTSEAVHGMLVNDWLDGFKALILRAKGPPTRCTSFTWQIADLNPAWLCVAYLVEAEQQMTQWKVLLRNAAKVCVGCPKSGTSLGVFWSCLMRSWHCLDLHRQLECNVLT